MKQEDKIINSLKRADEVFQSRPTTNSAVLSRIVYARIERRRHLRRNVVTVSLVLMVACILTYSKISHDEKVVRDVAYIKVQSEQLLRQSRLLASVAAGLNAEFENRREIAKLQNELTSINRTLQDYSDQQDVIVYKMLYRADFLAKDKNSMPQAVKVYNSMLEYFPESRHTATAKQRLSQIEIKKTELDRI